MFARQVGHGQKNLNPTPVENLFLDLPPRQKNNVVDPHSGYNATDVLKHQKGLGKIA